jgi:lysophospholipase L1-like esterase
VLVAPLTLALLAAPLSPEAAAAAPTPPMPQVIAVDEAIFGPPEWTCAELLAAAAAERAARTLPLPGPVELPASTRTGPGPAPRGAPEAAPDLPVSWADVLAGKLPGREPLPPQPLEGSPAALQQLRQALQRPQAGLGLRISVWGASHTAADFFTGELRRALQLRHGDGGHGFVWPAAMTNTERAHDLNLCSTETWRSDFVGRTGGRADGWYGPGGGSLSSADSADFSYLQTTRAGLGGAWRSAELLSLGLPGGGHVVLTVDDAAPRVIDTHSDQPRLLRHIIELPPGPHRLSLRPLGDGEVRLFGLSVHNDPRGVIVDAIGLRGRTARTWLSWDQQLLEDGLATLAPDVLVLAYGTNEAADTDLGVAQLQEDLRRVLRKARAAAPQAACVVIGPTDRGKTLSAKRRYAVYGRTALVAAAQRELTLAEGCAYWDWQQAMGGPGAALTWRAAEPPLMSADLIHLSAEGYARSAALFLDALDAVAGARRP